MFLRLCSKLACSVYWITKIVCYGLMGFLLTSLIASACVLIKAHLSACILGVATGLMIFKGVAVTTFFAGMSIAACGSVISGITAGAAIIMTGFVSVIGMLIGACILVFSIMLRIVQATPDATGSQGFFALIAGNIEAGAIAVSSSARGSKEKPILNYLKGFKHFAALLLFWIAIYVVVRVCYSAWFS